MGLTNMVSTHYSLDGRIFIAPIINMSADQLGNAVPNDHRYFKSINPDPVY